ncbi:MAG: helix-hairpin-helix domain-containing protein [Candidatus Dojkabacteria bacterium]
MNKINLPIKYRYATLVIIGFIIGLSIGIPINFAKPAQKDSDNSKVKVINQDGTPQANSNSAKKQICVDVDGAVNTPGVYCLNDGSMLINAISLADGFAQTNFAEGYVEQYINKARLLKANEKIYIPYFDEVKCELAAEPPLIASGKDGSYIEGYPADSDDQSPPDDNGTNGNNDDTGGNGNDTQADCVNLNTATLAELDALEGIGPSTAQKIIDARPFTAVEELLDVSGIGEAKYNAIKDEVCI